jgi:predicted KAP-like P-loop ATPase
MAVIEEKCETRLLADNPTREDAFGHKKVAAAIAELIFAERGAKCIGLNGSWGSGKSSVVEILRDELHRFSKGSIDIFVFDAWAHQGDPLRRSFLEQLINRLAAIGWLKSSKAWDEQKEELAKRLDVIQTVSQPMLTVLGGAIAVSLLLLPLDSELLKYLVDDKS